MERISSISSHLPLKLEGRWGTTDDFATSFLHFCLFSTALWELLNSRPVHSLMLSSNLFLCPSCLQPLPLCLARWFWPDLMKGKHNHATAVSVFLRSSGDLHVVQLPAGSWLYQLSVQQKSFSKGVPAYHPITQSSVSQSCNYIYHL